MSLKLGPADGMGLSFSAHCSIPFVITAGLGPRHCLFVSENLHSKCVGQQRLPPKKTLISGFIFGGLSTQWKKYFVKMTANPRNQSWTGSWSGLEHAPSLWATPFREVHKTVQHALATLRLLFKQGPQAFSTYTVIVFGLDLFQ